MSHMAKNSQIVSGLIPEHFHRPKHRSPDHCKSNPGQKLHGDLALLTNSRSLRARLPIDGRLATGDGADR